MDIEIGFTENNVSFEMSSIAATVKGLDGEKGEKGDKGDKGDQGEKGEKGDTGNVMFASFEVTENGDLIMNTPDGYTGPEFRLNENYELEVVI